MKLLLDAGADVNASDNESSTGLQKVRILEKWRRAGFLVASLGGSNRAG